MADTFGSVIRAYLASPKFTRLKPGTQDNYRRALNLVGREDILGAVSINVIRPSLIQGHLDGLASKPGAQQIASTALKALERWAIVRDLIPHPITTGTEIIGSSGDGHRPWTDAQIECAIQHAKPELARAIVLAANTGQRGSDLIKMRWTDIEEIDGRMGINVTQKKTGLQLWIPFTQALTAVISTWERRPTPLLLRDADGTPWKDRNLLSAAWLRDRDTNPALALCLGMALHGLRATACVRLRRLGATEAQISDMVGLSIPMVSRYCRHSVQKDNAMAAVHILDATRTARKRNESA